MKPRPQDRMKDPFFAGMMFMMEQIICAADRDAKEQGIILKDSQIQSALAKAKGLAAGKTPHIEEATAADRILKDLVVGIVEAPTLLLEESVEADGTTQQSPLPIADWIRAIEAVVESIKTRRSGVPGSRDYLNYVQGFIARAKGPG